MITCESHIIIHTKLISVNLLDPGLPTYMLSSYIQILNLSSNLDLKKMAKKNML